MWGQALRDAHMTLTSDASACMHAPEAFVKHSSALGSISAVVKAEPWWECCSVVLRPPLAMSAEAHIASVCTEPLIRFRWHAAQLKFAFAVTLLCVFTVLYRCTR